MRNVLGSSITLTLFGESHSTSIGGVLDGLPSGIKVNYDDIKMNLSKRRPNEPFETKRIENDDFEIISGLNDGFTTGDPLCLIIKNENIRSNDYSAMGDLARPSHADYVADVKYHGFENRMGGGHFSGRITSVIVALGSICLQILDGLNIHIGTHIYQIGSVKDLNYSITNIDSEIKRINSLSFPVLTDCETKMKQEIELVCKNMDSIGGIIQTGISNMPVGVGEPWFSSVEGQISNAMFSIGGIKGIEFGKGFGGVIDTGMSFNDSLYIDNDVVKTKTNNNGGINGGISNGMPIVFNCFVKPTPSIGLPQQTIHLKTKQEDTLVIRGRHDPAIIRRVAVVATALTGIVVCDMLSSRFGVEYLNKELK